MNRMKEFSGKSHLRQVLISKPNTDTDLIVLFSPAQI